MKIWLDDVREEPKGWVRCYWPSEVITLLEESTLCDVTLSLDHDLGDDSRGTGYDVLTWIEERVIVDGIIEPPMIYLHTANPVARARMQQVISVINRICAYNQCQQDREASGRGE